MILLLGIEPLQKLGKVCGGGQKALYVELHFGPSLRLGTWSLDQAEQYQISVKGIFVIFFTLKRNICAKIVSE